VAVCAPPYALGRDHRTLACDVSMQTEGAVAPSGSELDRNRLLASMPASDRAGIMSKLTPTLLHAKTVLFESGDLADAVRFPLNGVVALVTTPL